MKLPRNSLGVSDAKQWADCPKLFFKSMQRHTMVPGTPDPQLVAGASDPLSYGSAMHEAAEAIVRNPDIYLDDAVDIAWKKWSQYLKPEHHAELKEDCAVMIERTREALDTLELVASEEDWQAPIFVGRPGIDGDEEEGEWYYYRFRIDALYRKKDDPTHYVIRDFKSVRRQRFQTDVDEDIQFTGYDYGVRAMLGEGVEKVTIWYDSTKFKEIFSSRDEHDRQKFEEWIESTIKAILATPTEEVMDTFKLNDWCSWCPLLETCGVVNYANDLALAEIALNRGENPSKVSKAVDLPKYIKDYERSKQAIKALEEYNSRIGEFLKSNPGTYSGRQYYTSVVNTPKWRAEDVFDLIGKKSLKSFGQVSKTSLKKYLDDPNLGPDLMAIALPGGYERLNSKKEKE